MTDDKILEAMADIELHVGRKILATHSKFTGFDDEYRRAVGRTAVKAYRAVSDDAKDSAVNKVRYTWLADKVLACDYGDSASGEMGWIIRHCKGPEWIQGQSIDLAIDAAMAKEREGE